MGIDTIGGHVIVGVCWWKNEQNKLGLMVHASAWYYACICSVHQCSTPPHLPAVEHKWLPYCIQDFNTALLFAAKNASIGMVRLLLESGAHIEAKNTTVIQIIRFCIPKYHKWVCRWDILTDYDAFNIVSLAGVYDTMMTIVIGHVHERASLTFTFGVGWTQSPYVGDQTRHAQTRQSCHGEAVVGPQSRHVRWRQCEC